MILSSDTQRGAGPRVGRRAAAAVIAPALQVVVSAIASRSAFAASEVAPPEAAITDLAGRPDADAAPAIQAGIDRTGRLRLPSGVFRLDRPLRVESGQALVGEGTRLWRENRDTGTVLRATGPEGAIVVANGSGKPAESVVISGLSVTGAAKAAGTGVLIRNFKSVTLRDVTAHGFDIGVLPERTGPSEISYQLLLDNVLISECRQALSSETSQHRVFLTALHLEIRGSAEVAVAGRFQGVFVGGFVGGDHGPAFRLTESENLTLLAVPTENHDDADFIIRRSQNVCLFGCGSNNSLGQFKRQAIVDVDDSVDGFIAGCQFSSNGDERPDFAAVRIGGSVRGLTILGNRYENIPNGRRVVRSSAARDLVVDDGSTLWLDRDLVLAPGRGVASASKDGGVRRLRLLPE